MLFSKTAPLFSKVKKSGIIIKLYAKICNELKPPDPILETETRLLKVAIIGLPNAGKSTFINNLMDRKVCPTSSKVHTTRGKSMAIFTEGDAQIVFLDSPGLVSEKEQKRYNLEKRFIKDSRGVLSQADMIGIVHDVSNVHTREKLDIKIIKLLELEMNKPSFLVLNKIDILKSKRKLLDLTRLLTENCINGKPISSTKPRNKLSEEYRGWPNFRDIFMVSALTGDGLHEIKDYLVQNAKSAQWMFPHQVWTDQSAEDIIVNSVQATLLDFLPQEIPYKLKPVLEFFNVTDDGSITTVVLIECPTRRLQKLVSGVSDGKLRQINQAVQQDLCDTFKSLVKIKLVLVVPKNEKENE